MYMVGLSVRHSERFQIMLLLRKHYIMSVVWDFSGRSKGVELTCSTSVQIFFIFTMYVKGRVVRRLGKGELRHKQVVAHASA